MRRLLRPLLILLALVFLLEAWLWTHLAPVVGWVVARIPLRAIKAAVAGWIERLPPAATLVVFVVPIVVLLPFKFLGLWLLAHGHWLDALALLALAKLAGLGVTAFIFELTRPKLCSLPGSAGSMTADDCLPGRTIDRPPGSTRRTFRMFGRSAGARCGCSCVRRRMQAPRAAT
jgi:hypothetical protein